MTAAASAVEDRKFEASALASVSSRPDEIGRLAQQMAEAQNADLQNKKPGKDWRHAFLNVYLAFSPQNAAVGKERKWGIRNQLTRPGLGVELKAADARPYAVTGDFDGIAW